MQEYMPIPGEVGIDLVTGEGRRACTHPLMFLQKVTPFFLDIILYYCKICSNPSNFALKSFAIHLKFSYKPFTIVSVISLTPLYK